MERLTEAILLLDREIEKILKECKALADNISVSADGEYSRIIKDYEKKAEEEKKVIKAEFEKRIKLFSLEKEKQLEKKLSTAEEIYRQKKAQLIEDFLKSLKKELCDD